MGTRNLTIVIHNGETKIAQYGQWDGYPSGQGATVLDFLRSADINAFKDKLKLVRFETKADKEEYNKFMKSIGSEDGWMDGEQAERFRKRYPLLTRDNGAEILWLIYKNRNNVFLVDHSYFIDDTISNEWTYIVNLDNETLAVNAYCKEIKIYDINNLPSEKDFVSELEKLSE